jgi:hypothetical protein
MAPRGRPPLSEPLVRQRIDEYCQRYGVRERNVAGFPVFPAGKRETPQHREWMVLFKAFERLRKRQAAEAMDDRREALAAQRGRCPICLEEVGLGDEIAGLGRNVRLALVHPSCGGFLRAAAKLGPAGLDRVRAYLGGRDAKPPRKGTGG